MDEGARAQREVAELTRRLAAEARASELAENRLTTARADARSLAQHNEKLNAALRDAREAMAGLKAELEALGQPPQTFGRVVADAGSDLVDVVTSGRRVRVRVAPEGGALTLGDTVLLNEASIVVGRGEPDATGETVRLLEELPDGRLLVSGPSDEELLMVPAAGLDRSGLSPGAPLLADRRALVALSTYPRSDVAELVLEDVPDVGFADIGGLAREIEQIRDAIELPFRHRDLFAEYGLRPPKGVLLYGPPGCGKTMIAKAIASSLGETGSHFLNIKGPELLTKYVGETERQIRQIFTHARERARDGRPVVVFFDEMDSLFRTRGSGVSSDVESTVVPQLLSEIDGVEGLGNVVIIGATNREDLIDPAILRPGRLDVKIKLDRPDERAAAEILGKYLLPSTPLNAAEAARIGAEGLRARLISEIVAVLYARSDSNRFIEVTYAGGDKETLFVRDFISGAMLASVVARAKTAAIKDSLAGSGRGVRSAHLRAAIADEIAQNDDLPSTTNPDDWARVSGRKGERIVFLRTLHGARSLGVE
jgi:proteasome-associated ATPase